MLETLDGPAVRLWARACLAALGRAREEIDALNVFPVPDADTGTNLFLTFESACEALDALDPHSERDEAGAAVALSALAAGALKGAHGNSGVILSQLLRGLAEEVGAAIRDGQPPGPRVLAAALAEAAELAWQAVAAPAEGTMLTVARAAADAACAVVDESDLAGEPAVGPTFVVVAEAARDAAEAALALTPQQLPVLSEAGVVDAGGRGICILFDVLAALLGGYDPARVVTAGRLRMQWPVISTLRDAAMPAAGSRGAGFGGSGFGGSGFGGSGAQIAGGEAQNDSIAAPSYEVVYMVEASEPRLLELRATLEELCDRGEGDSLVIAGGSGFYRVHIHVDQPGPAIEAAIRLGRPHSLDVNVLTHCQVPSGRGRVEHADSAAWSALSGAPAHPRPASGRAVLAAAPGPGLATLFAEAGAIPLACPAGRPPTSAQLARAIAQAGAEEVVILINDAEGLAAASAAAERVHRGASGVRVAVVPSKAVVQGIAALAVHEPGRRFDADIVAMTAAAGATRHGALQIAVDDAWTMAGVCHAGDVLGFIDGDVALIAPTLHDAALALVDRMVSAGGEMVTLVTGDGFGPDGGTADGGIDSARLVESVRARVQATRPEMDVVAYDGGQSGWPLLIGVE